MEALGGGEARMRRIGGLFEAIASFENLYRAFTRASRSKRHRESVDRFSFRLEGELLRLRAELKSGTYRPGPMREFTIEDPKRRKIRAAPFRDRVLHHAVMGVLEPHFERWLDSDSYACRKGKGTDAALRRAVVLSRRGSWVLKTDVESFFATVDHGILKGLLARRLKDPRLLELLGSIIDHGGNIDHGGDTDHGTKTGMGAKGLPIGSLTSQWLANLYLAPLDRFVREALQPRGYLRYMDDFAVIADGKETLKKIRREVETWL
jgi:retron-type reverse transcriptase